jgi:tRNA nucleotidyltransferase (CCA-adding enzyme)
MPDPSKDLEVYLVGGAVRDRLLGLRVKDRDWVVVGATPDEMIEKGFKPVGKEFPVFLHPNSKEEYALARVENKTHPGYTGFEFDTSPLITLEQDLARRDLTINAMAETPDGQLIDYFGGKDDLHNGILRHVSDAFSEDPVRVLRVARFTARYGFTVADETRSLMHYMVTNGEVDALVPERVWNELRLALGEPRPSLFIKTLRDCGALERIFPEIDCLFGVPQPRQYHPEIDCGVHIMLVVDQAAKLTADPQVRFAALVHDLGKCATLESDWPSHPHHGRRGVTIVRDLCARLRVPNQYRDLAVAVCEHHLLVHRIERLKPSTVIKLFNALRAYQHPDRLHQFILACEADMRGRSGYEDRDYPQADILRRYHQAANSVDAGIIAEQRQGQAIGEEIHRQRCEAIARIRQQSDPSD